MSPSFVTPHPLVSEIAKCIAWGCLYNKNYIVYYNFIVVYSLKSMCIQFGCCVIELHGHLS